MYYTYINKTFLRDAKEHVKHFLEEVGVAKECRPFVWDMPLGGELVEQRSIACHKMNGEYEIVPGYHGLN